MSARRRRSEAGRAKLQHSDSRDCELFRLAHDRLCQEARSIHAGELHGHGRLVQVSRARASVRDPHAAGDIVLIRGGQFHGLIKSLDENMRLFMFGGYD